MWFARFRRRRRRTEMTGVFAELRTAENERRAGVTGGPEYEAHLTELRAKVAEWRASAWPDRYPG